MVFAAPDGLQRLKMHRHPIITQAGVQLQTLRLAAEPLKDAEAFVEEHRHGQIGGVFEALHGGRVVVSGQVEVGRLAGAVGPGGIGALDKLMGQLQVPAVGAFVADRPDNHRGMVPVPLHQLGGQLEAQRGEARVADDVPGATAKARIGPAERRLIFDVKPQRIGGVEGFRVRRVMGGAHGVEIGAFHQLDVPPGGGFANGPARQRVRIVPASAPQLHRLAVERKGAPDDLDLLEPKALFESRQAATGCGQARLQGVERGRLGAPSLGRADFGAERHGPPLPCAERQVSA